MKWLHVALVVLLWPRPADAQTTTSASTPTPAEVRRESPAAAPPQPTDTRAVLAQTLNPLDYGPAFNTGAQTEFVGPIAGTASLLVGYDAVYLQYELSGGIGLGKNPLEASSSDTYQLAARFGLPLHRGTRADFSLLVGGGATFIKPPSKGVHTVGTIGIGPRFRAFVTPNIALAAALGITVVIDNNGAAAFVGARPLGSAAVVYFFR